MLRRGAATTAALVCLAGSAFAFGSVNVAGQQAEHERITRAALAVYHLGPDTMDEIAGKNRSFGAVGAPDRPDRGLLSTKSAHCDGGDHLDRPGYPQSAGKALERLSACRAGIFAHLDAAVKAAGAIADRSGRIDSAEIPSFVSCTYNGKPGRAKCNVLENLGLAFHAAQDFYAHTNWVDTAADGPIGIDNPPGLGNSGPAPWLASGAARRAARRTDQRLLRWRPRAAALPRPRPPRRPQQGYRADRSPHRQGRRRHHETRCHRRQFRPRRGGGGGRHPRQVGLVRGARDGDLRTGSRQGDSLRHAQRQRERLRLTPSVASQRR